MFIPKLVVSLGMNNTNTNRTIKTTEHTTDTPLRFKKLGFDNNNSKTWYSIDHNSQYIELRFQSDRDYDYTVVTAKVYGKAFGGSFIHNTDDDRKFNNRVKSIINIT